MDGIEAALAAGLPAVAVGAAAERAGLPLAEYEGLVDDLAARFAAADRLAGIRARLRRLLVSSPHATDLATYEALLNEAVAAEPLDPKLAAQLYADAAIFASASDARACAAAAERSRALAERAAPDARAYAEVAVAVAALANGDPAPAAEFVQHDVAVDDREASALLTLQGLGAALYYLEEYGAARRLLEQATELAHRHGARSEAATVVDTIAAIEIRLGRYASARSKSLEALRLARDARNDTQAASCLTTLAAVDAIQGREADCRARVVEAAALVPDDHLVHAWGLSSLALLLLGLGRIAEAAGLAPAIEASFDAVGAQPANRVVWLQLAVECFVRLERRDEAEAAVERLVAAADGLGVGWQAVATRARALVARGDEAFELYERALELHARSPRVFERARTELCYGEALRRAMRRNAARVQLAAAASTFARLRAAPWEERARRELAAVGTSRRVGAPLTEHERRVASLVAGGATNREVAAALFVTPKTVEHHLTRIYAKLGIRSRTELVRALPRDV